MATKSKPQKGKSNAPKKITKPAPDDFKSITSVEAALKNGGYNPKTALPDVSKMPAKDKADYMLAQAELMYVVEAINRMPDGSAYQPDFTGNEVHYEPWHRIETTKCDKTNPAGFGFSYSGYGSWYSHSCVGARQLFRDYERYSHAQTHFESLYLRCKLMPSPTIKKKGKSDSQKKNSKKHKK